MGLLLALAWIVGTELWGFVEAWARRAELISIVPTSRGTRLLLAPLVFMTLAVVGWWRYFRTQAAGARVWALAAGCMVALVPLVMVLSSSLSGTTYPRTYTWGYPLCALAFLAYGIWGRERLR